MEYDEALIASYGGFFYNVPAYMLNLVPVLKVEGTIQLTGEATTLGSGQNLTIQFTQPSGMNESINKNLIAGAYYAVGMDLQGINENVLGKRNYNLTTNVLSQTAGTLGNDDLIGEHLHILMTTYFLANDKIYKSGAKLYNTTPTCSCFVGSDVYWKKTISPINGSCVMRTLLLILSLFAKSYKILTPL